MPLAIPAEPSRDYSRGLIDAQFKLTPAGNAYVDRLLAQRPRVMVTQDANGPRVRWVMRRAA